MTYTTPADIRQALDPTGTAGPATAASLTDLQLTDSCTEAQSEVDGRLAQHYTVPMNPVPQMAADITRDIAAYLATLAFRRGEPLLPGDPIVLRYTRAQTLLQMIVTGSIVLDDQPQEAVSSEPAVANPYGGAIFSPRDVGMRPAGNGQWRPASDWPLDPSSPFGGGGWPGAGYGF